MSHDSGNFYMKSNSNKLSHVVINCWRQAEGGMIVQETVMVASYDSAKFHMEKMATDYLT